VIRIGFALAIAAAMSVISASAWSAPLEAYGRLPSTEQVAISPDGQLLALVTTDGDKRVIAIERVSDQKVLRGFAAGEAKIRDISWAGSDHLLLTTSATLSTPMALAAGWQEWYFGLDINVTTGVQRQLMQGVPNSLNTLADVPVPRVIDGKPYAFVEGTLFEDEAGRVALFKIDLGTGQATLVAAKSHDTIDWLIDSNGEPLAEAEFDPAASRWTLKVKHGGHWMPAKSVQTGISHPEILGLGRDGRSILLSDRQGDDVAVRELQPDAEDWSAPIEVQHNLDLLFAQSAGSLIGAHALVGDEDRYTFYAPTDQAFWNTLVKAYPGQRVTYVCASADRARIVVLVDSPTEGPAYALIDRSTHRAAWIATAYNDVKPADIAPVQPVSYKAKDGLALTGYLTLPAGRPTKNLPLIVFPHGGPAARDEPEFDWWAQAMASRGYAVLQVNYRGSNGFGWAFLSAGFGEWGRKMQTDLSDGVRYLAAQGTIDPKRVCIVGASYGGYAALAGATLDPGVYRCAVDVSGISDMHQFVVWSKTQSDVSSQRYWDRFVGADGPNDPRLAAISPAAHAADADAPILLIHGKDDTVVPFDQSLIMVDALKKAGKPYEFVVLNNEDHWLSRGETRLQMLKATMDFVEKNNPPQ